MPSQRKKNDIIEDLSNAFIEENTRVMESSWRQHLDEITDEAYGALKHGEEITTESLHRIQQMRTIEVVTKNTYTYAGLTMVIQNPRAARKIRTLQPLIKLMDLYSVRNPEHFANAMRRVAIHQVTGRVKLNSREQRALKQLNLYYKDNAKEIKALVTRNKRQMKEISELVTNGTSKAIMKRRKVLINKRITVDGIKRPMTDIEIANQIKREFSDNLPRVKRILRTETHSMNELVKEVRAKSLGFNKKMWVTQRDGNVRDSHRRLHNKKVKINAYFNVGGEKAQHPGDTNLSAGERINCRCIVVYIK